MVHKKGTLLVACIVLSGMMSQDAAGQFGFAAFGKEKKQPPVLDPKGSPPRHSLLDFGGTSSVLTFDGPVTAVKKLNSNTQHALSEARAAIAKPFVELKNDMRQWTARNPNSGSSFQIIPDWMKPGAAPPPQQPATLGDWLSQDRPQ